MEQEKILKSDDKAAQFVTGLSGWVDRHGHFWGKDEEQARYGGCTHIACDNCGTIRIRNGYCVPCYEKKRIEKYNNFETHKWDGILPLYSYHNDEYFFDIESLRDYIYEHEISIEDMQLCICKPIPMQQLDESYFLDDMHEDAELSSEVAEAVGDLNELIRNQPTQSWEPDKYAAIIKL